LDKNLQGRRALINWSLQTIDAHTQVVIRGIRMNRVQVSLRAKALLCWRNQIG
jgi:hypothetical protein